MIDFKPTAPAARRRSSASKASGQPAAVTPDAATSWATASIRTISRAGAPKCAPNASIERISLER